MIWPRGRYWLEVEKDDTSRGCVPLKLTAGGPRFEEVQEEEPAPAPPVVSSDEDEAAGMGGEEEEEMGEEADEAARPPLDLVKAEVLRVFEDMDQFDIDDFMESEALTGFSGQHVEEALEALAEIQPPVIIIDAGEYPPYRRPPS